MVSRLGGRNHIGKKSLAGELRQRLAGEGVLGSRVLRLFLQAGELPLREGAGTLREGGVRLAQQFRQLRPHGSFAPEKRGGRFSMKAW